MKIISPILVYLLWSAAVPLSAQKKGEEAHHRVKILESNISVDGETNVKDFSCRIDHEKETRPFTIWRHWCDYVLEFENLALQYRVNSFECGMKAMEGDLQDLLNSSQYPELTIDIRKVTLDTNSSTMEVVKVQTLVYLSLAGVTKKVVIQNSYIQNLTEGRMVLGGSTKLDITDFGLKPPERLMGLVKVDKMITISYEVKIRADEPKK